MDLDAIHDPIFNYQPNSGRGRKASTVVEEVFSRDENF